jgi:hypothetical protein
MRLIHSVISEIPGVKAFKMNWPVKLQLVVSGNMKPLDLNGT